MPAAIAQVYDRYEQHGQAILRMLSQEERIPAVRQMTEAGRAYHRHWAQTTFAPLLHGLRGVRRELRLTTIMVATDLLVWKILRLDTKLPRNRTEQIVIAMIQGSFQVKPTGPNAEIEAELAVDQP